MEYRLLTEDGLAQPAVRVTVSNPDEKAGRDPLPVDSLLDTGADYCVVNDALVGALRLRPIHRQRRVQTANEIVRDVKVYTIEVDFPPGETHQAEALCLDVPYFVVGRNLLDRTSICFDGPNQEWHQPCSASAEPLAQPAVAIEISTD